VLSHPLARVVERRTVKELEELLDERLELLRAGKLRRSA